MEVEDIFWSRGHHELLREEFQKKIGKKIFFSNE